MFVTDWQIEEVPKPEAVDIHKDYGIRWENELLREMGAVDSAKGYKIQKRGRDRIPNHVQEAR